MPLIIVRLSLYSRYFFGVSTMATIFYNASNYTLLLVPITINETRVISLPAPPTLRDARILASFFKNASQFFTTTTTLPTIPQDTYNIYPFIAIWCLILAGLILCIIAVHMKRRLSSTVTKSESIGHTSKYDCLSKAKTWVSQQTTLSYGKINHGLCRCITSTMSRLRMVSMIQQHPLYLNT